jgi:predicted negative regulator of RcsB-dependent stress response
MNESTINKKNFLSQATNKVKDNIKSIIIFISLCFILFLSFQVYNFYSLSKIQKNSITFFKAQNLDDRSAIKAQISNLNNENNFYGILSKLELIQINLQQKNNQNAINLYIELLDNNNLDNIYKSAIASKASYQFIDLNFADLSIDYLQIIENFISYIDDDLIVYQGIKLELNYLVKILEAEKNRIEYVNFNEAVDMYNNIMNSDVASSAIKERINKIHEFFSYK